MYINYNIKMLATLVKTPFLRNLLFLQLDVGIVLDIKVLYLRQMNFPTV